MMIKLLVRVVITIGVLILILFFAGILTTLKDKKSKDEQKN